MDFKTTATFRSTVDPEISVTIAAVTMGRQMEINRRYSADQADGDLGASRAMWNALILDFEGLVIDGKKPTVDEFFLNGPLEVVNEISVRLLAMVRGTSRTDEQDERIIEAARQQITEAEERMTARRNADIAEAEKRIEKRKNFEPQSSTPTLEADTRTAADASDTQTSPNGSEWTETAPAIPIASAR